MNKSKNTSKKKSKRQNQLVMYRHPPQLNISPGLRHRFRFNSLVGITRFAVSWSDLLDMLWLATSAVTGYRLYQYVRLHEVEAWAPSRTDGTNYIAQSLNIEFVDLTSGRSGPGDVFSDTSMDLTTPAHIRARPRPGSNNAEWQGLGTSQAFVLTCPEATVIDVEVSFQQVITYAGTAIGQAPIGATTGTIYLGSLDGLRSGTTSLPPAMGGVNFI